MIRERFLEWFMVLGEVSAGVGEVLGGLVGPNNEECGWGGRWDWVMGWERKVVESRGSQNRYKIFHTFSPFHIGMKFVAYQNFLIVAFFSDFLRIS